LSTGEAPPSGAADNSSLSERPPLIETVVTTTGSDGVVNCAAMGVRWGDEELAFWPFEATRTLRNLRVHGEAVVHLTDDVLLFVEAALGHPRPPMRPASRVTGAVIEDANARRHALELAARDARYFAERLASAVPQPEPLTSTTVAFGSRVEILRDDGRRQTFRIVGEDEADPRAGSIAYVSPLAHHLIGKQIGEAVEMDGHEIEIVGCSSEQDCS